MRQLPFDPMQPPAQPPSGCYDPLLWHVSYALFVAHEPGSDGSCVCRQRQPCLGRRLSLRGLMRACLPKRDHAWGVLPGSANGHGSG